MYTHVCFGILRQVRAFLHVGGFRFPLRYARFRGRLARNYARRPPSDVRQGGHTRKMGGDADEAINGQGR